jgi:hypothetical protein
MLPGVCIEQQILVANCESACSLSGENVKSKMQSFMTNTYNTFKDDEVHLPQVWRLRHHSEV